MNKFKVILLSTLMLLGLVSLSPASASAGLFTNSVKEACKGATLGSSSKCDDEAAEKTDTMIKTVINLLTVVVGIVAVIVIIINGIRFITSGGDANNVSSARNGIIYALVGLIVVALAQVIVRFVLDRSGV